jgi:4-diphosphocytidyl-2-C-methyl-D-erythritol kinase
MKPSASEPSASIEAPAKLTLWLRVTGVRPDGYHLLDAEMVSVDLCDTLEIEAGSGLEILDEVVGGSGVGQVPRGAENLVSRALALVGRDARVRLTKRIPSGAGLGGGSSDGAAILRWAGVDDPSLAVRLGADVPFCVRGGRARVKGIGEHVEPLEHRSRSFLLLIPPIEVSTAAVYAKYDDLHRGERGRRVDASPGPVDGSPENDLESASLAVEPLLGAWRDCLGDATGVAPRLAGSGASWFVEGTAAQFGLEGRKQLGNDGASAALVEVRTNPGQPLWVGGEAR